MTTHDPESKDIERRCSVDRSNSVTFQKGTSHGESPVTKSWFERQSALFRERLMDLSSLRIYRQGSTIACPGNEIEEFIGILDGCAEIHWEGFGKRNCHVQLFWPGDWFGDYALITGKPRKVGAKTLTDIKAAVVPARALLAMLEEHPVGWRAIGELAAEHYELASDDLICRLRPGKDARCAAVLLSLVHRGGVQRGTSETILIPINQSEFGQLANLSRNSVGAALKLLREQGLVELQYGNIRICSVNALAEHLDRLIR